MSPTTSTTMLGTQGAVELLNGLRRSSCARVRKIAEKSLEMEKSEGGQPSKTLPASGGSFKEEALKKAGVSISTANDYESLIGADYRRLVLRR
jgi:hypothetical protein